MKVLLILVAVLVIFAGMGAFMDAIQDFQTDRSTQDFFVQTSGDNSTGVQLSTALWNSNIANASVSSNNTGDAPVVAAYTGTNRLLTVGGLATTADRILTVTYDTDGLTSYSGVSEGVEHIPLAVVAALIVVALGAVVAVLVGIVKRGAF